MQLLVIKEGYVSIAKYKLSCESYPQAMIYYTSVDRQKKTFKGGVYSKSGELIAASTRQEMAHTGMQPFPQLDPLQIPENRDKPDKHLSGRYLYLGYYTKHFGHFLLETLSRLWAAENNNQYDGYVFNDFVIQGDDGKLTTFANYCFSQLGIPMDKLIFLKEDTSFDYLDVPKAGFYIGNKAHPNQINVYRKINRYLSDTNLATEKVYLSRANLNKKKRSVVNEKHIEGIFKDAGFLIVHPQELTFDEQMQLYSKTKVLAGLEGSALHNSVFMPSGGQVINLCSPRCPNGIKSNQQLCNDLAGQQSLLISFVGKVVNEDKIVSRFELPHIRRWLRQNSTSKLLLAQ